MSYFYADTFQILTQRDDRIIWIKHEDVSSPLHHRTTQKEEKCAHKMAGIRTSESSAIAVKELSLDRIWFT